MGKLESALEKALRMRGGKDSAQDAEAGSPPPPDQPVIDEAALSEYLVPVKNPVSYITEEYRKLCTRIFDATESGSQNTLLVTSSVMGEGKSLTAINLALVVASKLDHTVLLVDCDLRNPSLHCYFGIEPEYGLVDYLEGRIDLPAALIKTGIGKMTLLPAGRAPANPVELLTSRRMQQLLKDIKNRYRNRYIIIDTTPVLTTADSIALAPHVDGVLFVVRERMVPKKDVLQALSLLKGANLLGVILNCDDDQTDSYYRRSYYAAPSRRSRG